MIGRVVSTKMNSTAAVEVTSVTKHPLYKKAFTRRKKYLADNKLGVKEGDIVEFVKIRPISKRKHWSITKVLGRDIEEIVSEQLKEEAAEVIGKVLPEEKEKEQEEQLEKQSDKPDKRAKKERKKNDTA